MIDLAVFERLTGVCLANQVAVAIEATIERTRKATPQTADLAPWFSVAAEVQRIVEQADQIAEALRGGFEGLQNGGTRPLPFDTPLRQAARAVVESAAKAPMFHEMGVAIDALRKALQ